MSLLSRAALFVAALVLGTAAVLVAALGALSALHRALRPEYNALEVAGLALLVLLFLLSGGCGVTGIMDAYGALLSRKRKR